MGQKRARLDRRRAGGSPQGHRRARLRHLFRGVADRQIRHRRRLRAAAREPEPGHRRRQGARHAVYPRLLVLSARGRRPRRLAGRSAEPDEAADRPSPKAKASCSSWRTTAACTARRTIAAWIFWRTATRIRSGSRSIPAISSWKSVRPMTEAYPKLRPYVAYVHVKDATSEPRQFAPAGAGRRAASGAAAGAPGARISMDSCPWSRICSTTCRMPAIPSASSPRSAR